VLHIVNVKGSDKRKGSDKNKVQVFLSDKGQVPIFVHFYFICHLTVSVILFVSIYFEDSMKLF